MSNRVAKTRLVSGPVLYALRKTAQQSTSRCCTKLRKDERSSDFYSDAGAYNMNWFKGGKPHGIILWLARVMAV